MCAETKNRRILIVDDDPNFLKVMRYKLECAGYEVRGFATAGEAGEILDSFSPDLVIVDRCLPDTDGVQWAGRIRDVFPYTPLFIVTALETLVFRNNARFDRLFGKPIKWDIFLDEVKSFVGIGNDWSDSENGEALNGHGK